MLFNVCQRNRAAPPNSTGLAACLPTVQHTPSPASPLGCPARPGLRGLTCHNSLSLSDVSLPPLREPQVRHSMPAGEKQRSPCPNPYPEYVPTPARPRQQAILPSCPSISPVTAAGQARWGDPCPAGSGLSLPHWGWGLCSNRQRR